MLAFLDFIDPAFRILYIALGIGFLIFIHEAGHFIAARICGVRAEIFSLGFGPPIVRRQWGKTEYRLSVIPLGGYVKMAGAEIGEGKGLPDELNSKSVGARFFIYSAGVIMNALFAFLVFPILFMIGMPFTVPQIGQGGPLPGGPAWKAGLREGDRILRVGGTDIHDLQQVRLETALADPEGIEFEIERNGQPMSLTVIPDYNEEIGIQLAEIGPAPLVSIHPEIAVKEGSEAHEAGLRTGDILLGVDGRRFDDLDEYSLVMDDTWRRSTARVLVLRGHADSPLPVARLREAPRDASVEELRGILRDEGAGGTPSSRELIEVEVPLETPPGTPFLLGIQPVTNFLVAVRAVGAVSEYRWLDTLRSIPPKSQIHEVNGRPIFSRAELSGAFENPLPTDEAGTLRHRLRWRSDEAAEDTIELDFPATDRDRVAEDLKESIALDADFTKAYVIPKIDGPAYLAGIRAGDEIVSLGSVEDIDEYAKSHETESWNAIVKIIREFTATQSSDESDPIRVAFRDASAKITEVDIRPERQPLLPFDKGGRTLEYIKKEENLAGAIKIGVTRSIQMFSEVYLTLKKMLTGTVSSKNLGSIIMISQVSYTVSKSGFIKFVFFLGLLSINLAFINILPIPVLDGGHLFFLIIEKIKGSPVNERVMGYSQMVGILLVLTLIIYATANDIMRSFFG